MYVPETMLILICCNSNPVSPLSNSEHLANKSVSENDFVFGLAVCSDLSRWIYMGVVIRVCLLIMCVFILHKRVCVCNC